MTKNVVNIGKPSVRRRGIITYKQYVRNSEGLFHRFFLQFVTKKLENIVVQRIGKDVILNSSDKHMNDIPLSRWDGLFDAVEKSMNWPVWRMAHAPNPRSLSLSLAVCIAKAAAKEYRSKVENYKPSVTVVSDEELLRR